MTSHIGGGGGGGGRAAGGLGRMSRYRLGNWRCSRRPLRSARGWSSVSRSTDIGSGVSYVGVQYTLRRQNGVVRERRSHQDLGYHWELWCLQCIGLVFDLSPLPRLQGFLGSSNIIRKMFFRYTAAFFVAGIRLRKTECSTTSASCNPRDRRVHESSKNLRILIATVLAVRLVTESER